MSAGLCGSFLLPGPEEVQVAAAARAGVGADRVLRVSPGCPAQEAPGVGLRHRRAPGGRAGHGDCAWPRLRQPSSTARPPSVQIAEIIAIKGADVPGQNWELVNPQLGACTAGGETGVGIPSSESDSCLFQLYFLFMLFKKSTATSRFQIMALAVVISSPLCGIYGARPVTNCAFILSAWKRRTKHRG